MNANDLDILTLGIAEAWNMYKIMAEHDQTYRKARFGTNIKFDINDYLKGRIQIKPKTGKALIRGKTCDLEEFETELENREKLIKDWLVENYTEEDIAMPRASEAQQE